MEANFIYFRANFLVNFALKGVKFIKFKKGVLLKIFSPFFSFHTYKVQVVLSKLN